MSVRVLQIEDSEGAKAARLSAMRALGALTETNPDVLEGEGCKALFSGLGCGEAAMEEATLEALLNCCVRHEHNRVNLVRLSGSATMVVEEQLLLNVVLQLSSFSLQKRFLEHHGHSLCDVAAFKMK